MVHHRDISPGADRLRAGADLFGSHTLLVNRAQRHVAVVAIGLACAIGARTINRLLDRDRGDGGWFMYAPNSDQPFTPSFSGPVWRESLVWLAAVAIWTLCAWRLYREPRTE